MLKRIAKLRTGKLRLVQDIRDYVQEHDDLPPAFIELGFDLMYLPMTAMYTIQSTDGFTAASPQLYDVVNDMVKGLVR